MGYDLRVRIVVFVAAAFVASACTASANGEPSARRSDVFDSAVYWFDAGDPADPPIVLLHGVPTSSDEFLEVARYLAAEDLYVIAPDLPGLGRSRAGPSMQRSPAGMAAYLEEFLNQRDIHQAVVVMTDLGVVGTEWIRQRPDRVASVVLYEAPLVAFPDTADLSTIEATRVEFLLGSGGEDVIVTRNVLVEENLQAGTVRTLGPSELGHYREQFTVEHRELVLATIRATIRNEEPFPSWFDFLASTDIPVTVLIASPGSAASPAEMEALLAANYPNAARRSAGAGIHYLALDNPRQLADALLASMPPTN